jgi:predicted DNA-binding transcriptional regulator AlpA
MEKMNTLSEVARIVGLPITTVSAYRSRGRMPEPDVTYGRTPLWSDATVQEWIEKRSGHPRTKPLPEAE